MIIRLSFQWYDLWIGFFYSQESGILYFCPLPTIVIEFQKNINNKLWIGLGRKYNRINKPKE